MLYSSIVKRTHWERREVLHSPQAPSSSYSHHTDNKSQTGKFLVIDGRPVQVQRVNRHGWLFPQSRPSPSSLLYQKKSSNPPVESSIINNTHRWVSSPSSHTNLTIRGGRMGNLQTKKPTPQARIRHGFVVGLAIDYRVHSIVANLNQRPNKVPGSASPQS